MENSNNVILKLYILLHNIESFGVWLLVVSTFESNNKLTNAVLFILIGKKR